jgi:hypothetical protein
MHIVMAPGKMATVAMREIGEATPLGIMTTLYELMAALQAVVAPDEDTLVVTTVVHLLRSRRLTWGGADSARQSRLRRQKRQTRPFALPEPRRQGLRTPCLPVSKAQEGREEAPCNVRRGLGLAAPHVRSVKVTGPLRWSTGSRTSAHNRRPSRAHKGLPDRLQHRGHAMIPVGKTASVRAWLEWFQEGNPTQQETTVSERVVSGARRLQAAVRRGDGWGGLTGLLLLPPPTDRCAEHLTCVDAIPAGDREPLLPRGSVRQAANRPSGAPLSVCSQ